MVISSLWYNENKIDVILAAITSQVPVKPDEDEYILSPKELRMAGLPKQSMVKAGKIVTIDRRLIRKKLGCLPDESLYHIKNILLKVHI